MTTTSTPVRRALRPSGRHLPEDTRRHHRALLLQLLFRYGPASRADLARSSGLTRVTVSDVVAGLVAEELLTESAAPVQGRVGKPPVLVQLAGEARQIVAVDLSADGSCPGRCSTSPATSRSGAASLSTAAAARTPSPSSTPSSGAGRRRHPAGARHRRRHPRCRGRRRCGRGRAQPRLARYAAGRWVAGGVRRPGLRGERRQHRRARRAHVRRRRRRRADAAPGRHRRGRRPGARGRSAARSPIGGRRGRPRGDRPRRRRVRVRPPRLPRDGAGRTSVA